MITIIVLLILAGISIAMLTGDNGILGQASEAVRLSEIAETKEKAQLDIIDWQTDQIRDGKVASLNDSIVKDILTGKDYVQSTGDTSFIAKNGGYEIVYSDLYSGGNSEENQAQVPLPAGATIIESDSEQGIVMRDKNNNEWVWIEVPKSVTENSNTDIEIETALHAYATDYRQNLWTDTWYEGCGLTETEYNTNKSKMLKGIKTNGGFWIGRYEVGTDTIRTSGEETLTTPLIQQDKYPYNFVTCSQAQGLASQLNSDNHYTSSLMYGIQWDLICRYIEIKGAKTQEEIKTDSTSWGNYRNATFDVTRGKYSTDNGVNYVSVLEVYNKLGNTNMLLTTGATKTNSILNIYDLAGNVTEWTLEKSINQDSPCSTRGGNFKNTGNLVPSSYRGNGNINYILDRMGFRSTLY